MHTDTENDTETENDSENNILRIFINVLCTDFLDLISS